MEPDTWVVNDDLTVERVGITRTDGRASFQNLEAAVEYARAELHGEIQQHQRNIDALRERGIRVL